jgi:hypothetical protein
MRPSLKGLVKIGLMLGSIVVTLLALELALRAVGFEPQNLAPRRDSIVPSEPGVPARQRFQFRPGVTARSEYASNPRGYFDAKNGVDHVHNSVGWRDVEHAVAKPPGVYRILGLGDSYLWGQGVKREDICLTRLEAGLNARLDHRAADPTVRIETINAGLSGLNTADERDLLLDRGLRYSPDLVIVHFVLNDVEADVRRPGPKVEFFKEYAAAARAEPDWLTTRSRLWAWAKQRFLGGVQGRKHVRESVQSFDEASDKWQRCRAALDDIAAMTEKRGIALLVVIFPFFYELDGDDPFGPIHDVVRAHCESRGIDVLDLRSAYRGYSGPELWVHPTDQHPNEIAHEIAATAILDYLLLHADRFRIPVTAERNAVTVDDPRPTPEAGH